MDPISAGIAVGGSLINGLMQGSQNRANRRFQERENQKARDYNTMMWEKNNAYNDPTQQMARLKNAGINPHLAYSQGGVTNTSSSPASSNASSMPEGRAPQLDVNAMLNARLVGEQINNIKADTLKKEAEARNIGTDTEGKTLQNGISTKVLENWQNTYEADMSFKKSATSVNYSNIQVNDKKIQVSDVDIKKSTQEIVNLMTTNTKLEAEINSIIVKTNLDEQSTKNLIASLGVIYAQIQNYKSQTTLNYELAETQKTTRSNIEADIKNKSELYKSLRRSNKVGDEFDFKQKNVDYNSSISAQRQIILKNIQTRKESGLLDSKITAQDIENALNSFTAPAKAVKSYFPFSD